MSFFSHLSLPFQTSPLASFPLLPMLYVSIVQPGHPRLGSIVWLYPSPNHNKLVCPSERIILDWNVVKPGVALGLIILNSLSYEEESDSLRRDWTLRNSDAVCSDSRWEEGFVCMPHSVTTRSCAAVRLVSFAVLVEWWPKRHLNVLLTARRLCRKLYKYFLGFVL